MKLLIFFLILGGLNLNLFAFAAQDEWECIKGKIRLRMEKDREEQRLDICFNADRTRLKSGNCRENKCIALGPHKLDPKRHTLPFGQGSPGFKYCMQSGGSPKLLEFFDGKRWWELDRCYFAEDKSFVNTALLP